MFRHYSFVIFVCVIISAFLITYEISPETEIHDDVTVQETVKSVELKPKYLEIQAGEILIKSYDREQAIPLIYRLSEIKEHKLHMLSEKA